MLRKNRNLLIIAIVAVVNALGYGIIIPILYTYSQQYGLSDFQNGLLFAIFSVCQFTSTPIIGRMSDKYGRKPLLLASLIGTTLSFVMMAFAPSAFFLFLSRALDGLTAGNLPVAQAVISDSTAPEERARGFGIIGASFGFGFVFGPVISALTVGISHILPFLIAAAVSLIAVIITAFFLPETNKHMGEVQRRPLFDFKKLYHALFDQNVGPTLLITLLYSLAFSLFIFAFQPYSVKILALSANQISLIFTMVGAIGLVMQLVFVQRLSKRFGLKRTFSSALLIVSFSFLLAFFFHSFHAFLLSMVILGLANALVQPLITTVLSRETDAQSQGTMMGVNASYASIGQILGPILGGAFATLSIAAPFLAGSLFVLACLALSFRILRPGVKKESAF